MKVISKVINIVLAAVVLVTVAAAAGSTITKKPFLLSVIRSNSMYPVWERGDLVIIENLSENAPIRNGDIVFFKTKEGNLASKGWIAHRIMSGNSKEGFTTKGDANPFSDQETDRETGMIKREWIAGRAITIGESPIVIPKLGFLSLWAEKYHSSPYAIPFIAIFLAILIAFGEMNSGNRRRKKSIELELIYILGGLTISLIVGGAMLASGQRVNLVYEVSTQSKGVLMGSNVGLLKVGDEVSKPLSEINNEGFFPLISVISTNDKQVALSHVNIILSKGEKINTTFKVSAQKPGNYRTSIRVGIFYPLLPASVIFFLAQKSYWLTLVIVSLIPGLPLLVYPFIDRRMRGRTLKLFRRKTRKWQNLLPF